MAVAIGLISIILIYGAYGYGINTKTGQIIQNGLLFVDSHPHGAQIYLNDQYQGSNTAARLILPAGKYSLTVKKSGYRDWRGSFNLDAHAIARFTYPMLFPTKPRITALHSYTSEPKTILQSPDERWLLVQAPTADKFSFDEYDTTHLAQAPLSLDVPASLLTGGASGRLSLVEWSTDNKNVLLKHTFVGGSEFVVFNRAAPSDSFNVNKLFGISPANVALKNKKISQLYLYDHDKATLSLGDVGSGTVAAPLLSDVLAFKTYGNNLILYVTNKAAPAGQAFARIWSSGQTYPLYTFPSGSTYLIDLAQYANHWYYIAGSNATARINIYKDPLSDVNNTSIGRAIPLLSLNLNKASHVSFSNTSQYIEGDNAKNFSVYDILNQKSYDYKLNLDTTAGLRWMDGSRLIGEANNRVYVMDYDATNPQFVVDSAEADGGFFSPDFNHLFTIQSNTSGFTLENIDMRAGRDLPKNPAA